MVIEQIQGAQGAQESTPLDMEGGSGVADLDEGRIYREEKPPTPRAVKLESDVRSYMMSMGKSEQEVEDIFGRARDAKNKRRHEKAKLRYELRAKRAMLGEQLDDAEAAQGIPKTGEDFNELAGVNEFKQDPASVSEINPERQSTEIMGRFSSDTGFTEYATKEAALGVLEVGANIANIHLALIDAERSGESHSGFFGFLQGAYSVVKAPLELIPFVGEEIAKDFEEGMIKMYGSFMDHAFGDGERSTEDILKHRIPRFYIPTGPEGLDLSDPQNMYRLIGNMLPAVVAGSAATTVAINGVALTGGAFATLRAANALKTAGLLTKADRVKRGIEAVNKLKAVKAARDGVKALGQAPGVPTATKAVTGTAKLAGKGATAVAKSPKVQAVAKGTAKLVADSAIAGGVAEVVSFRKDDYRLAHVLQDMDWGDAWGTMVVSEVDDPEWEQYNNQFNEGATLGLIVGVFGRGAKVWLRAGVRRAKALKSVTKELDKIIEGEKLAVAVDEASSPKPKPKPKQKKRARKKASKKATAKAEPKKTVEVEPDIEADELVDEVGGAPAETPKARQIKKKKKAIEAHKNYKKVQEEATQEAVPVATEEVVESVDEMVVGTAEEQVKATVKQADEVVDSTVGLKKPEVTGQSIISAVTKTAKETDVDLGAVSKSFIAEDLPSSLDPSKNKLVNDVLNKMRVSPKAFALLRKNLPLNDINRLSRAAKAAQKAGEGIPFSQLTPEQQQLFRNMGFSDNVPAEALGEVLASTRIMLHAEDEILKHSHGKLSRLVEARQALERQVKEGVKGSKSKLAKLARETDEYWEDMMSANYVTDKVNSVFSKAGHFLQSAVGRGRHKAASEMRKFLQGLLDDGQLSPKQMQDEYLKFAKAMKIDKIDYDNFVSAKLEKHQLDLERSQMDQQMKGLSERYGLDESVIVKREARIEQLKKLAKDNGCG